MQVTQIEPAPMSLLSKGVWAAILFLATMLVLVTALTSKVYIDEGYLVLLAADGLFLGFYFGILSWIPACILQRALSIPAKLAWKNINLGFYLCILLLCTWHLWYFSRSEHFEAVKSYVAVADPALEMFVQKTGHYPSSLKELHLQISAPPGLLYSSDPSASVEFIFTFGPSCYQGNGQWVVGDPY